MVFPSIMASDGCRHIGTTFVSLTTSMDPRDVSTWGADVITSKIDFDNIRCPPASYQHAPAPQPWAPRIVAPEFLYDLHPEFARTNCVIGALQGIDPPIRLERRDKIEGPRREHGQHPRAFKDLV